MSDLEKQANIENMSDDESLNAEDKQTNKPTFPPVNIKNNSNTSQQSSINPSNIVDLDEDSDDDAPPPPPPPPLIDEDSDDDAPPPPIGEDSDDEDVVAATADVGSDIEDMEENMSGDEDDDSIVQSDNENDDDDISIDEDSGVINKKKVFAAKKTSSGRIEAMPSTKLNIPTEFEKNDSDYESDNDDEEEDDYLQKFDRELRDNYILEQHPEAVNHNYDEIYNLAKVQRNKDNIIVDSLHKTIPILTKYEKTRIIGQRAKQLNNGAKPLVKFSEYIIDGYLIALKELEEKKIPVIIRRPLPTGASEYWHLKDLEILI